MLVVGIAVGIVETHEIGLGCILPTILELLGIATTTLMETGVADVAIVGKNLTSSLGDGFSHVGVAGIGDALVTLAMVVGTDIKDGVVFTIVPANDLIVFLDKREETVGSVFVTTAFFHLGEYPGARDDRMGLKELKGCRGRHLAGDDTHEVSLERQFVDGNNLIGFDHDVQCAFEGLFLLALPMEVHTNGNIVERERGFGGLWGEGEVTVLRASPHDASLAELYCLRTCDGFTLGHIVAIKHEGDLLG